MVCENGVTAVIPAYNEEGRIGPVVASARSYVDEVLVVDDGSSDYVSKWLIIFKMGKRGY